MKRSMFGAQLHYDSMSRLSLSDQTGSVRRTHGTRFNLWQQCFLSCGLLFLSAAPFLYTAYEYKAKLRTCGTEMCIGGNGR